MKVCSDKWMIKIMQTLKRTPFLPALPRGGVSSLIVVQQQVV